jgi:hypothetical protein
VLEYLVRRDGGIETICGSGTYPYRSQWVPVTDPNADRPVTQSVHCVWILGIVHSTLALAASFGQRTHYQGRWQLGVHFDGVRGAAAAEVLSTGYGEEEADKYGADQYEMLTLSTSAELADDTPAVVDRLVGNFLRGLGIQNRFLPYTEWHANGRVAPKPAQR